MLTSTQRWMPELDSTTRGLIRMNPCCREMNALDLLIEDCWIEVLKRVKDPEDLKSCSETCLTFQEILKNNKNEFMFSLILPHILGYLRQDKGRAQEFEWKPLLKCRLVCQSWCKSVDQFPEAGYRDIFHILYQFDSKKRTERFLQKFATHCGNPFIGRRAVFFLRSRLFLAGNQAKGPNEPEDPAETCDRNLREILERFGSQLWNIRLYEVGLMEHMVFCQNLHTILRHLQNLRFLHVWSSNLFVELSEEEETQLTTYIAANEFVDLPQLEDIEATGINVVLSRLLLKKYAPQLKSLTVDNPSGFPEQASRFCNLEKLKLDCLDAGTSLQYMRQLSSPLRSLTLVVNHNPPIRDNVAVWPIDELFRNIQHLPVQELDISIRDTYLGESRPISAEDRPHHDSISTVTLSFQSGSASLNFLLYCPNLESMSIARQYPRQRVAAGHPNGTAELLDVNDLLEQVAYDLYLSNIWENASKLKSFTIWNAFGENPNSGGKEYARGEFEKLRLANVGENVGN